jgi:hypothetical protein
VVFRTGPSAKLPDCRAYELVTPEYTGGTTSYAGNFSDMNNAFDFPLITSSGNSVVFTTVLGALSGSPGSGLNDRYRARRTTDGWTTEFIGPTAEQTIKPVPGGQSPDHEYYFLNAGFGDFSLEPESTLEAPFGGHEANYLRKPNGDFELIARGSLGEDPNGVGRLITAGAGHVIFTSKTKLEPQAPPTGSTAVYDRTPGGPTHVVSVLPVGGEPEGEFSYEGASSDGSDVVFADKVENGNLYDRHDNSTTSEVARFNGLQVGEELSCAGSPASATLSYQWLRNGSPIGGATNANYTATAADESDVLQCQVTASNDEGASVKTSDPPLLVAPFEGTSPPEPVSFQPPHVSGTAEVGNLLTCEPETWRGNPTFTYQWLSNGVEIVGAGSSTYTTVATDEGAAVQCRLTATNADGTAVGDSNVSVISASVPAPSPPVASVNLPAPGVIYAGVFGGQVFYGTGMSPRLRFQEPGNLFSYDIATGATTRITDTGDARFSHVSADGSHVYFISESQIGGEGVAGQPNLFVWARAGNSTKFIATVEPQDLRSSHEYPAGLASWTEAVGPEKSKIEGLALSNTRSTPDGSVFLFETTAQLTGFDNTESAPAECGSTFSGGERCPELYRYDTASEALTCVSCPAGPGPATGHASIGAEAEPITELNPVASLSADGSTVFFQSTEDLLAADGNGHQDVYEWKEGGGLALISTGQSSADSFLYGVTPNGSDVAIWTREALLPQDQNVGTGRIYDARVNGGFPPPESTVTEPCSGDACQGAPAAAPESPQVASSALNGSGNLPPKPTCAKGRRRVVSRGSERCVKPRHRKHHKHRRAHAKGRAAR